MPNQPSLQGFPKRKLWPNKPEKRLFQAAWLKPLHYDEDAFTYLVQILREFCLQKLKKRWHLGLRPRPRWRNVQRSTPLAWSGGVSHSRTLLGRMGVVAPWPYRIFYLSDPPVNVFKLRWRVKRVGLRRSPSVS